MYEGPAPAGLAAEAWQETRRRLRDSRRGAAIPERCHDALPAFPQHEEVVIWLDHRLSDQLILIKALDWFSGQNLGAVKLSLICIGRYPGRDHFVGLGELTSDQLASLADTVCG